MTALRANALTETFPQAGEADWRAVVDKALKGADFNGALTSTTRDGSSIQPLYAQTDEAPARPSRAIPGPWSVCQRIDHPDAGEAASLAAADLEGAASGLVVVGAGGIGARGFGAVDAGDLDARLDGVFLDMVRIRLDTGADAPTFAEALAGITTDASATTLDPAWDPVASFACGLDEQPGVAALGAGVASLAALGLGGTLITGDGRVVHDSGGTPAQELGYVLAALIEALRAADAAGLPASQVSARALAVLSADADIFAGIAKQRAMRLIWARALESSGLEAASLRIEAEAAWRMTARYDVYVNMLRTTAAVSAAGLGGADGVTVLPHTLALGLPDAFARRVARNIQNVLIMESNLHRVADPAGGSGYIESLTADLAAAAWGVFQQIEAAGGAVAAVVSGAFPDDVAGVRETLLRDVAHRREPLTGVSEFPNLDETAPAVLMPVSEQAPTGVLLPPVRLAAPFEALRDAAAAAPERPLAFLACLGHLADYNARALFAQNLLAAGGIAVQHGDGGDDLNAIAAQAAGSGARLAVICGSDGAYGEHAGALTEALKRAGMAAVWLAGRETPALAQSGIDAFAHARCDSVSLLGDAHAALGLSAGGGAP